MKLAISALAVGLFMGGYNAHAIDLDKVNLVVSEITNEIVTESDFIEQLSFVFDKNKTDIAGSKLHAQLSGTVRDTVWSTKATSAYINGGLELLAANPGQTDLPVDVALGAGIQTEVMKAIQFAAQSFDYCDAPPTSGSGPADYYGWEKERSCAAYTQFKTVADVADLYAVISDLKATFVADTPAFIAAAEQAKLTAPEEEKANYDNAIESARDNLAQWNQIVFAFNGGNMNIVYSHPEFNLAFKIGNSSAEFGMGLRLMVSEGLAQEITSLVTDLLTQIEVRDADTIEYVKEVARSYMELIRGN